MKWFSRVLSLIIINVSVSITKFIAIFVENDTKFIESRV